MRSTPPVHLIGVFSLVIILLVALGLATTGSPSNSAWAQSNPTPTLAPASTVVRPLPAGWGPFTSTSYDVQNTGLSGQTCFAANADGTVGVDWSQLYHAGTDWFLTSNVTGGAGVNVVAIAPGRVNYRQDGFYPGAVVILEHKLPDGSTRYSQYGHIVNVQVSVGQLVAPGQVIGVVLNQGQNTHVHWEVRYLGWKAQLGENPE